MPVSVSFSSLRDPVGLQLMRMTQAGNTVSCPDSDGDWVVRGASEAACKEIQVRA